MKWFKHDSTAIKDEKIQMIMDEFGLVGYALYFILCELCAEKIDKNLTPNIEVSWPYVERLTHSRRSTVRRVLNACATHGLLVQESNQRMLVCSIPNLLKRLDNYTKDLEVSTKTLPSKSKNKNKKQEVRSKNEIKSREKPALLSDHTKNLLKKDYAETHPGTQPESEAAEIRVQEINNELAKKKDVRNPIGLARSIARQP